MNNVYVPVALAEHGWPDNVRKDFTSQVQGYKGMRVEFAFNKHIYISVSLSLYTYIYIYIYICIGTCVICRLYT